jgi:fatty acid-binding protein DegV
MGKLEKVIEKYCKDVLADNPNPDNKYAFVTYTTASEEMVNIAKSALVRAGFETIYETTAGATITSHCGENTLGILFLNK